MAPRAGNLPTGGAIERRSSESKWLLPMRLIPTIPHDILSYIKYPELEQEADVKWKKIVEVYSKQGKLKNWLAVCDVDTTLSAGLALGLFLPQLSDEPWKGKVVAYSKNPRLHSIQGEDLNSRAKFMQTLIKSQDWTADFGKVFDVILEEAVNANLKPDKMVKKVLALTTYKHFLTGSNFSFWGETNYKEIWNKYKEKGYGEVVPHLVIWNMIKPEYSAGHCREPEPGVTLLSGFSYKLLEFFFENDGDIGPNHVVEAAVSAPAYQTLAVVD
ncbi:uncharacterized protein LOC126622473 [Malus sylvestris]|uniref:uncharacterized protein LOC126622473 n=1 Tax=Malus sylvestris TaxID=3752 RepID=UPI0021AC2752|nr:uncharacterized protein LOC126622473 [Malus sylvestris]